MRILFSILFLSLVLSCSSKTSKVSNEDVEDEVVGDQNIENKPYSQLISECAERKAELKVAYLAANENPFVQDSVLVEAQQYLIDSCSDFFRAWYFTPWTFNGHSETPKEGSIACGYFVTTTLRDMGFKIPRVKWAQQTSEYMIKQVSSDIKRFRKKPMEDIINDLENRGEGLYIVGLDCHVGYIYYRGGKMLFIHSNYYSPNIGVMPQQLIGRNPLNDSIYRIIGKIFDKEMTRNWLVDFVYPT